MRSDIPQIPFPVYIEGMRKEELQSCSDIARIAATQRFERVREAQQQKQAQACLRRDPNALPMTHIPPDLSFLMTGHSLRQYLEPGLQNADISIYTSYLKNLLPPAGAIDTASRDALFLQSRLLEMLFNMLLQAASPETNGGLDIERLKVALMAQQQCRQVLDSLSRIHVGALDANKLKECENAY